MLFFSLSKTQVQIKGKPTSFSLSQREKSCFKLLVYKDEKVRSLLFKYLMLSLSFKFNYSDHFLQQDAWPVWCILYKSCITYVLYGIRGYSVWTSWLRFHRLSSQFAWVSSSFLHKQQYFSNFIKKILSWIKVISEGVFDMCNEFWMGRCTVKVKR